MRTAGREKERRQARHQLSGLTVVVACGAVAGFWAAHAPADAVELRIAVSALQSQAAELEAVDEEQSSGKLDPAFVREHIRQLAKINLDSFRELTGLSVEQDLTYDKRQAVADGRQLVSLVGTFEAGWPAAARAQLHIVRARLQERQRALRS